MEEPIQKLKSFGASSGQIEQAAAQVQRMRAVEVVDYVAMMRLADLLPGFLPIAAKSLGVQAKVLVSEVKQGRIASAALFAGFC